MLAAAATLELLRRHGVDRLFGNPGTTELPLLAALPDGGLPYVLALHEGSAVAMADGYARGTGRPAALSLHIAAGVANGLSGLLNARRSRVPLVVTAGQQDRRHLDQDPMLAGDLVALAAPVCKTAVELQRAEDLPQVLDRAVRMALAPPAGPVFVSLPVDLLCEEIGDALPEPSPVGHGTVADGIERAAELLAGARRPALVAGDGIGRAGAIAEAVAVAERLDATVYLQPMYDHVDFPASHPLAAGLLPPSNAVIREVLAEHDVVLLAGVHAFAAHYYSVRDAVPATTRLVQLDEDAATVARNYPVAAGLVGGVRPTLAALAARLAELETHGARLERSPLDGRPGHFHAAAGTGALGPAEAIAAAVSALPSQAVVVDEAVTNSETLRATFAPERPGSYHHTVGGALGWGVGAAIGLQLADAARPVVAFLGDGSATYGLQGLWTAARLGVPATFVVLDNREYRAVRHGLELLDAQAGPRAAVVSADLDSPPLDWPALAAGFGVRAVRADDAGGVADAVRDALAAGAPTLIDVRVAGSAAEDGR